MILKKDFQAIAPGSAYSLGYFTYIQRKSKTETKGGKIYSIDAFDQVFIVCATGMIATDEDGQISSTTPIKYCETAQEAIDLVNQLNSVIGTKDLSLPYAECPHCRDSENVRQSTATRKKGELLIFNCPACEKDFQGDRLN